MNLAGRGEKSSEKADSVEACDLKTGGHWHLTARDVWGKRSCHCLGWGREDNHHVEVSRAGSKRRRPRGTLSMWKRHTLGRTSLRPHDIGAQRKDEPHRRSLMSRDLEATRSQGRWRRPARRYGGGILLRPVGTMLEAAVVAGAWRRPRGERPRRLGGDHETPPVAFLPTYGGFTLIKTKKPASTRGGEKQRNQRALGEIGDLVHGLALDGWPDPSNTSAFTALTLYELINMQCACEFLAWWI